MIEIMIAVAILSIAVTFIYATFISQQKSALVQEDVSDVQQNARIAMDMVTRDIRGAGAGQIPGVNYVISPANFSITSTNFLTINATTSTYVTTNPTQVINGGVTTVTVPVSSTRGFSNGDTVNFIQPSNYVTQFSTAVSVSSANFSYSGTNPPVPALGYLVTNARAITYSLDLNTHQLSRSGNVVADDIQNLYVQPQSPTLAQLQLISQTSKAVSNQYNGSPRIRTLTSNIMVRQ